MALIVAGESCRYRELREAALSRGSLIARICKGSDTPWIGVFGSRSRGLYESILAVLSAGKGYVPLHPDFPHQRTAAMMAQSGMEVVSICAEADRALEAVLPLLDRSYSFLCEEDSSLIQRLSREYRQHDWIDIRSVTPPPLARPIAVRPADPAYLLFTSGSTGVPKGVEVTHANVTAYLRTITELYQVGPADRHSQTFDSTFDLSVHDLFVSWTTGATLAVVPRQVVMAPARWIQQTAPTIWFSVPSVAMFLSRMKLLKADAFPSLRLSLFCGEALSANIAQQWQLAAPHSIVDNLYGPTEATIAICRYRWSESSSPAECRRGLVPIGQPFPGQKISVRDSNGRVVVGEPGELWLAGSQVTPGYWQDFAQTAERYVENESAECWYRTGDLVEQGTDGCLHFIGRVDSQVQIRGHRVELSEVESVLRAAAGTDSVVALAWPCHHGRADGIVAIVAGDEASVATDAILAACRRKLPEYMVPRSVRFVPRFPLNSNGKIDRRALTETLGAQRHDAA